VKERGVRSEEFIGARYGARHLLGEVTGIGAGFMVPGTFLEGGMKKMKGYEEKWRGGAAAVLLALAVFAGCDDLTGNTDAADGETKEKPAEKTPEFSFRGVSLDEYQAAGGATAGSLDAAVDQGALSYTLAEGEGGGDNGSFEILGTDVLIKPATLSAGEYHFRVRAADSAGKTGEKTFSYTVGAGSSLGAPGGLKAVPGIRELSLSWQPVGGAVSYVVLSAKGSTALSKAVPAEGEAESGTLTLTGLEDSTVYTVWVRAKDAEGKLGAPGGPVSSRKTSDPVNPFWYSGDFDYWDSETDGYEITATALNYNTMSPWSTNDSIGGFAYKADIRYYAEFDPAEVAEKVPKRGGTVGSPGRGKPKTDTGKWGEDLTGYPVGVFIVEYRDDRKPEGRPGDFFGVYFYGLGAVQTNSSNGLTTNHVNDRLAYLGNSIGLSEAQGGPQGVTQQWDPETETLEEAIERFTVENMHTFIAFVATPWYRIKGTFTNDNQNNDAWVKGGGYSSSK
jgi:hypothetical protein